MPAVSTKSAPEPTPTNPAAETQEEHHGSRDAAALRDVDRDRRRGGGPQSHGIDDAVHDRERKGADGRYQEDIDELAASGCDGGIGLRSRGCGYRGGCPGAQEQAGSDYQHDQARGSGRRNAEQLDAHGKQHARKRHHRASQRHAEALEAGQSPKAERHRKAYTHPGESGRHGKQRRLLEQRATRNAHERNGKARTARHKQGPVPTVGASCRHAGKNHPGHRDGRVEHRVEDAYRVARHAVEPRGVEKHHAHGVEQRKPYDHPPKGDRPHRGAVVAHGTPCLSHSQDHLHDHPSPAAEKPSERKNTPA